MTRPVVSISPDMPTRDIAALLLTHRISAVPVVDASGTPIGMVSEGDLIGRGEQERVSRDDWWLAMLSGQVPVDDAFMARMRANDQTARHVMSAPLVTVTEDAGVSDIARLFAIHHIKRVPVVRDGTLVGIVSRANLLHVVADGLPAAAAALAPRQPGFLTRLFGEYHLPAWETVHGIQAAMEAAKPLPPPPAIDENRLAASDLRHLATDFHAGEVAHREEARRIAAQKRRERARELIDQHVWDEDWRQLMHRARVAAENGEREIQLLRFPGQLCLDGGRAINVHETDWPTTLRGRPAEIYLRWERELKPQGFGLAARVMEFPDGVPGDVALFLIWGEGEAKGG